MARGAVSVPLPSQLAEVKDWENPQVMGAIESYCSHNMIFASLCVTKPPKDSRLEGWRDATRLARVATIVVDRGAPVPCRC